MTVLTVFIVNITVSFITLSIFVSTFFSFFHSSVHLFFFFSIFQSLTKIAFFFSPFTIKPYNSFPLSDPDMTGMHPIEELSGGGPAVMAHHPGQGPPPGHPGQIAAHGGPPPHPMIHGSQLAPMGVHGGPAPSPNGTMGPIIHNNNGKLGTLMKHSGYNVATAWIISESNAVRMSFYVAETHTSL